MISYYLKWMRIATLSNYLLPSSFFAQRLNRTLVIAIIKIAEKRDRRIPKITLNPASQTFPVLNPVPNDVIGVLRSSDKKAKEIIAKSQGSGTTQHLAKLRLLAVLRG